MAYPIGIDLGTTNSAACVWHRGRVETVPVEGRPTMPSAISVRADGTVLVGQAAKTRTMLEPAHSVTSAKRFIGDGKTQWQILDKIHTPVDVSALVLKHLKEAAEVFLSQPVSEAVITVPAYFNNNQKRDTKLAGEAAGLRVLQLLPEPTAAAISYGLDKGRDQTILVYDLGGGTFDVSILKVESTKGGPADFKILAKEGVPRLGEDDFDRKIMEIAAERFKRESGIDVLDLKKDQGISAKVLREAQQKLKDTVETAKRELSEIQTAQITIPNLIKDESGNVHNLDMEITRNEFNDAIRELILQSKEAVEKALASARLGIEDISRIILVGGSTKVPLVKEMLTEMFGKEPYSDTDPDTVVARGAAIFGATLGVPSDKLDETEAIRPEDQPEFSIIIKNIVTHFLGIETVGGKFNCLIEKGLEIPPDAPLSLSKEFTTPRDNMMELAIRVYQSDRAAEFVGMEGVKCIGEFFLTGIPPKPRGQERVTVTFSIDQQNLLKVKATSSSSAGELEIQRS